MVPLNIDLRPNPGVRRAQVSGDERVVVGSQSGSTTRGTPPGRWKSERLRQANRENIVRTTNGFVESPHRAGAGVECSIE